MNLILKIVRFFVLYSFIVFALFLSSCSKQNKAEVSGNIKNAAGSMLVYYEPFNENSNIIDSVKVKKNGNFKFVLSLRQPKFLNLSLNDQNVLLLAQPGETLNLEADFDNFASEYTVSGSDESKKIKTLSQAHYFNLKQIDSVLVDVEQVNDEAELEVLKKQYADIIIQHKKYIISHILEDMKSLSNIAALYQKYNESEYYLNSMRDIQYFKIVRDSLKKYYPNLSYVNALDANTNSMIGNYHKARLMAQVKDVQKTFPDIALPDIKGDTIKLHDKEGKYTLLFFWAPGLKDNRAYSRQLINVYKTYKDKGFDIFQVAFNTDFSEWKKVVVYDEIPWTSVCDTRGAQSPYIGNFNVSNFPTIYLISPDFEEVVGKNLSLRQLDLKLNYLINEKN